MARGNRLNNVQQGSFPHSGARTKAVAKNALNNNVMAAALSSEDTRGLNREEQTYMATLMHEVQEMPLMQALAQGSLARQQKQERQQEQAACCPGGGCR